MVFSTNQARQIYVAKEVNASPSEAGQISLAAPAAADYIYFKYQGPDTPVRSDLITKGLVTSATLTHGKNIQKYLKQYEVALDPTVSPTPVASQEYFLRINLLGYASLGVENTYQKYGYVKVTSGMTASSFYIKMAQSLAANFSGEPYPIYEFFVVTATGDVNTGNPTAATYMKVTPTTNVSTLTGTYTKVVIREVSGPWKRGTDEDMPQMANIYTNAIIVDGVEQSWGVVTEIVATTKLKARQDSVYRQLADLEYFSMGERADKYRFVGWPKVIYTDYMIDSIGVDKSSNAFGIIDIHYSYVGSNESVQKSEKDCCVIAPYTVAESIATAIANAGVHITKKDINGAVTVVTGA